MTTHALAALALAGIALAGVGVREYRYMKRARRLARRRDARAGYVNERR